LQDHANIDFLSIEDAKEHLKYLEKSNRILDQKLFELTKLVNSISAIENYEESKKLFRVFSNILKENLKSRLTALFASRMDDLSHQMMLVYQDGVIPPLPDKWIVSIKEQENLFWSKLLNGEPYEPTDSDGRFWSPQTASQTAQKLFWARLIVPVVHNRQLHAVAILGEKIGGGRYSASDLRYCSEFSRHAASRFHLAALYEKSLINRKELDRTLNNLSILYDVGRSLNCVQDLKSLLLNILTQAIAATSAQKGSIMLWDPSTNKLVVRVVKGLPDLKTEERINAGEDGNCIALFPGQGVAGKVFSAKKPLIVQQTNNDPEYVNKENTYAQSILCVPLLAADDAIGVINITNKNNGQVFNQDDLAMISMLANQAAVAINKTQFYEMAITDELTKLYIRRYFNLKIRKEVSRALRYDLHLSLAMIDIDHFKIINDTFGHPTGDLVLKEVARLIKTSVRTVDICSRYGGEEFAVILPETDINGAFKMAERLRLAVASGKFPRITQQVTISIGLASFPHDGKTYAELISAADKALYEAKRLGRNYSHAFCRM